MTGLQIKPIESIQMRSFRTISERLTSLAIALALLINSAPKSFAAYGASEVKFNKQVFKAGETITLEFKVSRPIPASQKYSINVGFSSTRDSFNGVAELLSGDYAEGIWRGEIRTVTP